METTNIKKYIAVSGTTYEIGDLYGDAPINAMEEEGTKLSIYTEGGGSVELTLKPGDYIVAVDGSARLVKSKFDLDETD